MRRCSRTACGRAAAATLTYVYADQTAVLGRLASLAEPHTYDLCPEHARGLTAPRGWQLVRLTSTFEDADPYADDLLAVANAVRARPSPEATRRPPEATRPAPPDPRSGPADAPSSQRGRRGHLRVIQDD